MNVPSRTQLTQDHSQRDTAVAVPIAALSHRPRRPWAHCGVYLNAGGGAALAGLPGSTVCNRRIALFAWWESGSGKSYLNLRWKMATIIEKYIQPTSLCCIKKQKSSLYNHASSLWSEWRGQWRWRQERVGQATQSSLQGYWVGPRAHSPGRDSLPHQVPNPSPSHHQNNTLALLDFPPGSPYSVVHPSASPPCPSVWHRAAEMIPTSPVYSQPHSIPHRGTLLMFETRACFALTSNSKVASSYIWNQNRSSFPCPRNRRLLAPPYPSKFSLTLFPSIISLLSPLVSPLRSSTHSSSFVCNFSCIDSHTFSHPMSLAKRLQLVNVLIKSHLYFLIELTFFLNCASR